MFLYMEHIAADNRTWTWSLQRLLTPPWSFIADNCHFTRTTWEIIEQAGFTKVDHERFWVKIGWNIFLAPVRPMLVGYAVK